MLCAGRLRGFSFCVGDDLMFRAPGIHAPKYVPPKKATKRVPSATLLPCPNFFRVGSWSLKCIKFFVVVMYLALINLPVSSGGSTACSSATCGSICCQAWLQTGCTGCSYVCRFCPQSTCWFDCQCAKCQRASKIVYAIILWLDYDYYQLHWSHYYTFLMISKLLVELMQWTASRTQ